MNLKDLISEFWKQPPSVRISTLILLMLMLGIVFFKHIGANKSSQQVDTNQKIENSQNSVNIKAEDGSTIMVQQGATENKTSMNWEKLRIQIDRILDDSERKLNGLLSTHETEQDKLVGQLNARGLLHGGDTIYSTQQLADSYKSKVNDLLRDTKRGIEDILFNIGQTKLETLTPLRTQNKRLKVLEQKCDAAKRQLQTVPDKWKELIQRP